MSLADQVAAVVAAIGAELKSKVDATRKVNGHPLTADVTVTKADVGLGSVDNTADASKSVASAAKLTTPRTINGVAFDGTANITVADSTKVPTSRTVNGKPLSANVTLTQDDVADGSTAKQYTAAEKTKLAGIEAEAQKNLAVGTAAGTVCAGNDARLSNQRTPSDGSVTNAKVAANAAIALSKLATGNVVGSKSGTAADLTVWVGPQANVPTSRDPNTVYLWY